MRFFAFKPNAAYRTNCIHMQPPPRKRGGLTVYQPICSRLGGLPHWGAVVGAGPCVRCGFGSAKWPEACAAIITGWSVPMYFFTELRISVTADIFRRRRSSLSLKIVTATSWVGGGWKNQPPMKGAVWVQRPLCAACGACYQPAPGQKKGFGKVKAPVGAGGCGKKRRFGLRFGLCPQRLSTSAHWPCRG